MFIDLGVWLLGFQNTDSGYGIESTAIEYAYTPQEKRLQLYMQCRIYVDDVQGRIFTA